MWGQVLSFGAGLLEAGGTRLRYALAGFLAGAGAVLLWHSHQVKEAKADQLAITAAAQAAIIKEQQDGERRLADALADRDRAVADLAGLRVRSATLSERLRSAPAGSTGKSAGNSCDSFRKPLRECRRLLAESIDLAAESAGLAAELSADRDAVAKALGRQPLEKRLKK